MVANTILTTKAVTELALAVFQDELPFLMSGNRQFEGEFGRDTYKRGQSVDIRKQNHYRADDGRVASIQATDEQFETLTIAHQYNVAIEFNTKDLTLSIGQFKERYIDDMIQELKFKAETDIAEQARTQLYFTSGTAGAPINTYQAIANVNAKMTYLMMPTQMSYMALNPFDTSTLKGSLQNSFNDMLNKDISERGALGHLDIFDMYQAQALARQVAGAPGGSVLIDGTVSSGAVINMKGFPFTTLVATEGDIFRVATVNSVTPIGRRDTSQVMDFIVTANVTSDGAGDAPVPIAPTIISDPTNPRQNVSIPLADGLAVTFLASHNVSVGYTRKSLDIVSPPLEKIYGSDSHVAIDKKALCSMRIARQGDIKNDINIFRVDILMGFKWHPQYAVRFIS
jgi:hypothetical protein